MKTTIKWCSIVLLTLLSSACKKSAFLDKKPATNILTPTTLADFQKLLDNAVVLNTTGGLNQLSADDIAVADTDWPSGSATERNAYIWAKDIYGGDLGIADWNQLYQQVFYANSVLDGLPQAAGSSTVQGVYIKGQALFIRAFAFYDLARTFCKPYDAGTAATDLGIPLRLKSGIDQIQQRATLQQSFDQIVSDLSAAAALLPAARPVTNLDRSSKIAAYALMARIYLDMRNYAMAENYANQALNLYSTLIDYNTVNVGTGNPFSVTNDEVIYSATQVNRYGNFPATANFSLGKIPAGFIGLYAANDLRLKIFFGKLPDGSYYRKVGYYGIGYYPFTGLATDELYLIKAECLARDGQTNAAMDALNQLLVKRYDKSSAYVPLTAASPPAALTIILSERSKELIWRGIRWYDLRRLNKEGANITLNRTLNGITYTLPPNDNRWVMPIPADEISLSGIQQNPR